MNTNTEDKKFDMEKLLKDLGLNNVDELAEYIFDPAHQDEQIVKDLLVLYGAMVHGK